MWFAQSLVGVLRAKYTERNLLEIKLESLYYILGLFTCLDKRKIEGWVKTQDSLFRSSDGDETSKSSKRKTLFYVSMNLKGIIDISFVILYKKIEIVGECAPNF